MGISYGNNNFWSATTFAYATLRQSVAGNSTFRGIVFCNLGTPIIVISNFVTSRQIETPYISPYGYPNGVPGGKKMVEEKKNDEHTNVLIPWYPVRNLTIASSGFFFLGAYGSLPDAAIWWCLRTGGGGVLTRPKSIRIRAPWESSSRLIERSRISSRIPQDSTWTMSRALMSSAMCSRVAC